MFLRPLSGTGEDLADWDVFFLFGPTFLLVRTVIVVTEMRTNQCWALYQ
jgi:hypothetical protein